MKLVPAGTPRVGLGARVGLLLLLAASEVHCGPVVGCGAMLALDGCGPSSRPSGAGESGESGASSDATTGELSESSSGSLCPQRLHEGDLDVGDATDLGYVGTVTHVTGEVTVSGSFYDLSFFECLLQVDGRITITRNDQLQSLGGLGALSDALGGIAIFENPALESLHGLASLRHAGLISVEDNARLSSIGLDSLEDAAALEIGDCVGGGMLGGGGEPTKYGNPMLTTIDGLGSAESIDEIYVRGNDALVSLAGLETLAANGAAIGHVDIRFNGALPTDVAHDVVELVNPLSSDMCGNLGDPEGDECTCGID